MKKFLNKVLTINNLNRVITIFIIGMFFRYLINDYLHSYIIEYINCISILIGSTINYLLEPLLLFHCKFYSTKYITYINDNNKSVDNNYFDIDLPLHYYDIQGRISLSKPSEISHYNLDNETRKRIASQIFEEIAQPPKFKEIPIACANNTGHIYLGIRYYDKSSDPVGLYIKYFNIFNQMSYWYVWEKEENYLKFSEIRESMSSKMNIWKEINDTTGTNVVKEVRMLLKTDPFHVNKHNR
uniref:Uncharacterized protein n=3 Tax=Epichloe TaxID=5112 RepID=A0A1J0D097_EPINE|nr:hypothetical protein [Epichloe typhina]YP_009327827.1 hypothetical protein [Epichloe festucae]YP_010564201.1 hypothetical protein OYW92_mgp39 [Epichloe bromicola]APB96846.1 hypothetical protein [Epichloe hybrida]APB96732.1 hypothetical protein [Epichloe typhina]APB96786.1 hypothetical protein [Epichloe festucae]UYX62185.1 hypothetical protein [Epichloe bromicola]